MSCTGVAGTRQCVVPSWCPSGGVNQPDDGESLVHEIHVVRASGGKVLSLLLSDNPRLTGGDVHDGDAGERHPVTATSHDR